LIGKNILPRRPITANIRLPILGHTQNFFGEIAMKILKRFGKILLAFVGLLLIAYISISIRTWRHTSKTYKINDATVMAATSEADLAEGRRLFLSRGCADCHGESLAGETFINDGAMGRYTGANLTTGKGGVLADRTDADLERAIRHGVGKGGRALIFMPALDYAGMSDQDVGRLIAYIRSQPPIDNTTPETKIGPLAKFLFFFDEIPVFISAEKIDHTAKSATIVKPELTVGYGKYVAQTCTGCHNHIFTGGPIQGAPPEWPPASNITGKGMESYSETSFITALRTGKRPNGTEINPIMPWKNLSHLTDTELKALWMYLKTL
jgi:cytochrome c553